MSCNACQIPVLLLFSDHNLRSTPNCTDSYIEIRKDNSSGVLLKRQCDASDIDASEYEDKQLYLFLRYRPNSDESEPDVEEPNSNRPLFKAQYEKISGGTPPSRYVANPVIEDTENVVWTLDVGDQTAGILVTFQDIYLPEPTTYLRVKSVVKRFLNISISVHKNSRKRQRGRHRVRRGDWCHAASREVLRHESHQSVCEVDEE